MALFPKTNGQGHELSCLLNSLTSPLSELPSASTEKERYWFHGYRNDIEMARDDPRASGTRGCAKVWNIHHNEFGHVAFTKYIRTFPLLGKGRGRRHGRTQPSSKKLSSSSWKGKG